MSKLFKEWLSESGLDERKETQYGVGWKACRAAVLLILKAETRTAIEDKGRSWEDVLKDL